MDQADPVVSLRPLLSAIAYRMRGSVADAEDVLQDVLLRWHRALGEGTVVESPKAWLSAVVTRLCLDHLRSARVRREEYVGPWLSEPPAFGHEPDVADAALLGESLSSAFLLLLETLSPKERAVFLLHDVFAYGHVELGAIVGESEGYCRQLARRARRRLAPRRPRFAASPTQQQRLNERFVRAAVEGDLAAFVAALAEDVTLISDGAAVHAARHPVYGADKVARFLLGLLAKAPPGVAYVLEPINGRPGVGVRLDGRPFAVLTLDADEAIPQLQMLINPDKLPGVGP